MDRFLNLLQNNLAARMMTVGLVVGIPTVLSVTGLGAAYVQAIRGGSFPELMLMFFMLALSIGMFSGFGLLYPLEHWVMRERALSSPRWGTARVLLYGAAGIPIGLIQVFAQERFIFALTPAIQASYFMASTATFLLIGLVYSYCERLLAAVQRREARLKQQIEMLKIEIDEVKREKQVSEIVETDFFQNLKEKAATMRAQVSEMQTVGD